MDSVYVAAQWFTLRIGYAEDAATRDVKLFASTPSFKMGRNIKAHAHPSRPPRRRASLSYSPSERHPPTPQADVVIPNELFVSNYHCTVRAEGAEPGTVLPRVWLLDT